jgi:hypothetical protein
LSRQYGDYRFAGATGFAQTQIPNTEALEAEKPGALH